MHRENIETLRFYDGNATTMGFMAGKSSAEPILKLHSVVVWNAAVVWRHENLWFVNRAKDNV